LGDVGNLFDQSQTSEPKVRPYITVEELYLDNSERLSLSIINNDASFGRKIKEQELHRPGLALSGFIEVFTYWRIQIMGNTEIGYLNTLHGEERLNTISTVLGFDLPCIIVTHDNMIPHELIEIADQNRITIFSSPYSTTTVTYNLSEYLNRVFAPYLLVHGSLIDVYGVGMLIAGPSAIGKSELTLDLIERGHQLVADDAVHITKIATDVLQGSPNKVLTHHMEIRGLGIIDVRRMFGIRGIRGNKNIDVVVKLELWDDNRDYERLGVDEKNTNILNVEVPLVELPIFPGKNITVIAEVIAMNHQLKQHGEHPAKELNEKLINSMQIKTQQNNKTEI